MDQEPKKYIESPVSVNPRGLIEALDLMELGIELKKQRIIRESPDFSPERVLEEVQKWISSRSDTTSKGGK